MPLVLLGWVAAVIAAVPEPGPVMVPLPLMVSLCGAGARLSLLARRVVC